MDNFDHEENTKSGIEGSRNTILMLFQNGEDNDQTSVNGISAKPESTLPINKNWIHTYHTLSGY